MSTNVNELTTLLIVQDSRVSRMIIRALVLDKHPDWIITEAASGDQAMQLVDDIRFDYCTMDINMPGLLGTDAAERILTKYPHMRIAIFSANIQDSFRSRAANLGAHFVAKPVTETSVEHALTYFRASRD